MKLMNRILLAVAFDDALEQSVDKVAYIARQFAAEIIPVTVVDYTACSMYAPRTIYEQDINDARKKMDALCSRLEESNLTVGKPVVKLGDVSEIILKQAEELDVNLIVMGAAKKAKLKKLFLGSTAEKIVRKSAVPVLLNHPNDHSKVFKKILCAVDLSPSSEQVIKTGIHLARILKHDIEFLHVDKNGIGFQEIADGIRGMYLGDNLEEVNDKYEKHIGDVRQQFERYMKHFDIADLDVTLSVKTGQPEDVIARSAEQEEDVLLLMGAHGHSGFIHDYIIGSTTDQLLRAVPCSVLTLKGKELFTVAHDQNIYQSLMIESIDLFKTIQSGGVPDLIDSNYQAGLELLEKGLLEDAIIEFKSCIGVCPEFYRAYEHLAEAYRRLDNVEMAITYTEMCRAHKRYLTDKIVYHDSLVG